jgi:hypothetical protein
MGDDNEGKTIYHICSVCGYSRRDVQKVVKHIARSHPNARRARVMETKEPPSRLAAAVADFVEFISGMGRFRRRR